MLEVIGALGFGEGVEGFADLLLQAVDRSLGGTSTHGASIQPTRRAAMKVSVFQ